MCRATKLCLPLCEIAMDQTSLDPVEQARLVVYTYCERRGVIIHPGGQQRRAKRPSWNPWITSGLLAITVIGIVALASWAVLAPLTQ